MRTRTTLILAGLLAVLLVLGAGATRAGSPTQPAVNWRVVGSGGADMASAGHVVRSTLGQLAIGPASSPEHEVGSGYWYGATRLYRVYLPVVVKGY